MMNAATTTPMPGRAGACDEAARSSRCNGSISAASSRSRRTISRAMWLVMRSAISLTEAVLYSVRRPLSLLRMKR